MKAHLKNASVVWAVERIGPTMVQLFSGQIRVLVTRAEFESDWIAA